MRKAFFYSQYSRLLLVCTNCRGMGNQSGFGSPSRGLLCLLSRKRTWGNGMELCQERGSWGLGRGSAGWWAWHRLPSTAGMTPSAGVQSVRAMISVICGSFSFFFLFFCGPMWSLELDSVILWVPSSSGYSMILWFYVALQGLCIQHCHPHYWGCRKWGKGVSESHIAQVYPGWITVGTGFSSNKPFRRLVYFQKMWHIFRSCGIAKCALFACQLCIWTSYWLHR